MFSFLSSKKKEEDAHSHPGPPEEHEEDAAYTVLVMCSPRKNWGAAFALFAREHPELPRVHVVQAEWRDLRFQAVSGAGRPCHINVRGHGIIQPDLCLVRSMVRGLTPSDDHRNLLLALRYAGVPAINSWESIYAFLERPWVHASLQEICDANAEAFPLIPQVLFPSPKHVSFPPESPQVLKVGHAEAGYGKARVADPKVLEEAVSLLSLHTDYLTLEPLIPQEERAYDLRIQAIGPHRRAYKRESSNWKGNVGSSVVTEIEMTDEFHGWLDLVAPLFGGMDIFTVDAIHKTNGENVILEVNDTASGFAPANEIEDEQCVCQIVVDRLIASPALTAV